MKPDKETLYRLRHDDGLTLVEIGEIYETSASVVWHWLRVHEQTAEIPMHQEGDRMIADGAVDIKGCPSTRCQCEPCIICGFGPHTAIHGPAYGQPPGSTPWDHPYTLQVDTKK